MTCPHCQSPLPDPTPRFCDACGMSTGMRPAPRADATTKGKPARPGDADAPEIRCPECGMPARTRRCRGCGAPVRWPDDVEPPGEDI